MYNYLIKFYISANCAFFDNTDYRTNNNEKPHYVEILNHHKIDISTEAGRKELREKAKEYLWSLRGKKVECPILEKEFGKPVFIEFSMRGLKKTSRFLANYKKEKKQQIEYYIHLFNKIKINKEIIKVNLSIEKQGNLFYYDMQLDKNSIIVLDSCKKNVDLRKLTLAKRIQPNSQINNHNITNNFDDVNSFLNLFNDMQLDKNSIIVLDYCKKNTNLNLMQAKQLLPSDQIGDHNVTNNFDDVNSFLNLFFENEFCC